MAGLPAILPALWYIASRILSDFSMKTGVKQGHAPLPLHKRIPQATPQISEAEWRNIADNQDTGYSCFIVVNGPENQVWVNEDTGAGMALYCFRSLRYGGGRLRCCRSVKRC